MFTKSEHQTPVENVLVQKAFLFKFFLFHFYTFNFEPPIPKEDGCSLRPWKGKWNIFKIRNLSYVWMIQLEHFKSSVYSLGGEILVSYRFEFQLENIN